MLQRIQSIYLFLAALAIFALYLFPLAHNVYINDVPSTIKITGIYQDIKGQQVHTSIFVALTAVTAIIALIPVFIIFKYKNRKQQVAFSYSTILVIIGYSYWLAQTVKSVSGNVNLNFDNFGIGILLSSVSIVLLIAAAKAIQRDEKLVKSADRLR